jgi:5-methylcytosine-specific restriction endonuclease McrA
VAAVRRQLDCSLCQPCLNRDRLQPARTVDHIVPLHVRPDWRLELENTQVICNDCHRRKTLADSQRYGSSTARNLTEAQRNERQVVQGLRDPPRAGLDE